MDQGQVRRPISVPEVEGTLGHGHPAASGESCPRSGFVQSGNRQQASQLRSTVRNVGIEVEERLPSQSGPKYDVWSLASIW